MSYRMTLIDSLIYYLTAYWLHAALNPQLHVPLALLGRIDLSYCKMISSARWGGGVEPAQTKYPLIAAKEGVLESACGGG